MAAAGEVPIAQLQELDAKLGELQTLLNPEEIKKAKRILRKGEQSIEKNTASSTASLKPNDSLASIEPVKQEPLYDFTEMKQKLGAIKERVEEQAKNAPDMATVERTFHDLDEITKQVEELETSIGQMSENVHKDIVALHEELDPKTMAAISKQINTLRRSVDRLLNARGLPLEDDEEEETKEVEEPEEAVTLRNDEFEELVKKVKVMLETVEGNKDFLNKSGVMEKIAQIKSDYERLLPQLSEAEQGLKETMNKATEQNEELQKQVQNAKIEIESGKEEIEKQIQECKEKIEELKKQLEAQSQVADPAPKTVSLEPIMKKVEGILSEVREKSNGPQKEHKIAPQAQSNLPMILIVLLLALILAKIIF